MVVPVYKGGGKDPLLVGNYRGVTLSSVVTKVLEFLVLERLHMVFLEASIPHPNQSAYRKRVSCADAIFASQEVVARYLRGGSQVFMCLYDLQKAFDSVEYPVLLERLYEVGVSGKCWRLLKSWYEGATCQVKVGEGMLSEPYPVRRGVKQGSILTPALFLLVMVPLLKVLDAAVRACEQRLCRRIAACRQHQNPCHKYRLIRGTGEHGEGFCCLKLSEVKCPEVMFSRGRGSGVTPWCEVDGSEIPVRDAGKCLGYWWRGDLMASRSVEENIRKA